MDDNKNSKVVLKVVATENNYEISAEQGSSVNEMAFAVMAVIRSLIKQKCIKDKNEFIALIDKYYNDPQYEIQEDATEAKTEEATQNEVRQDN